MRRTKKLERLLCKIKALAHRGLARPFRGRSMFERIIAVIDQEDPAAANEQPVPLYLRAA